MDNSPSNASSTEDFAELNVQHIHPDSDNAIFRQNEDPDENDNFLADVINPYLPPYLNPNRYPSSNLQNTSNSTFEELFLFTPTFSNVLLLIGLIICTLWVIATNLLIIGALYKGHGRDKEHVTDMYLINLAFADVLLGIFVFPFMSIVILIGYFPLSTTWCNIWVYFDYYLIIASSYGFTALMCSYYLMLRWPNFYPKSKRLHSVAILFVWILSNAPWTAPFFHDRVSFIYPQGVCGFSIEKNRYFTFYIGFTGLYIPLAISLIAGILAVKYLKQSSRAPFLKLLLKNDSCHVHPFTPTTSASESEFNDLYTVRRENGMDRPSYNNGRPRPGLSPSDIPSESPDRSHSPKRKQRHVFSVRTFKRNKALHDSVRKHFPLVATSLILFVVCRSMFYTYFGIGSVVPKLFPPDLSHNVYWLMHSYAVLAPVLHLVMDADLRRSVIRFVNEGTFQLPPFSDAVNMTGDKAAAEKLRHLELALPPVSVIGTTPQQHRNERGRSNGKTQYV